MPEQFSLYVIIGIAAVILVLFFFASYVKAPPSYAYIISGLAANHVCLLVPEVSAFHSSNDSTACT